MIRFKKSSDSGDVPERKERSRLGLGIQPIYHGYHGFDDGFFYAYLWSSMAHSHNIHIHDCRLVDESGEMLAMIDDQGFDAGESDVLNPEMEFEPSAAILGSSGDDTLSAESGSGCWLDSFGGSGCSSCGGGCGGG